MRIKDKTRDPNVHSGSARDSVWGEVFTRFEDIDRNSFALVSLDEVTATIEAQRRATAEKVEAERGWHTNLTLQDKYSPDCFP